MATILVLTAGILWGMIGIFVRKLSQLSFGSMEIVSLRAITTSILLFLYLFIFDRKKLVVRGKDLWCFLGTGILSIVFFNFCYFNAITLTSLSMAAILLYTAPAILTILSFFLFQEKITKIKVLSLVLTFAGCVCVTGVLSGNSELNLKGLLAGLGAGLGYALYSVFSRFALQRGYHSLTISFYTFLFAIFGTLPLADAKGMWLVLSKDINILLFCFVFGLVSTVIPYITYTTGMKNMENSKAAIIASVEPVAATLLGVLVYHEKLSFEGGIGALLVLSAIIICNLKFQKKS